MPGDLAHSVAAAGDVLNVERRVNVDAGIEQLEHVLVTFRMTRARRVRVREFIDNRETGMPGEDRIEIHLLELRSAIVNLRARHDWHAFGQRFGFLAAVRFDNADHDLDALLQLLPRSLQHGVGLAHARRHAEKNLELAARWPRLLRASCCARSASGSGRSASLMGGYNVTI